MVRRPWSLGDYKKIKGMFDIDVEKELSKRVIEELLKERRKLENQMKISKLKKIGII